MNHPNFDDESSKDFEPLRVKDLQNLRETISEILQPIEKIRGAEYTYFMTTLFCFHIEIRELQFSNCLISELFDKYLQNTTSNDPEIIEDTKRAISENHERSHTYSTSLMQRLKTLTHVLDSSKEFNGIEKDVGILLARVVKDWINKGY